MDHRRSLLAHHTGDVANQASRRSQVFVESFARPSVPLLGFVLSIVLSVLIFLLLRRMEMFRSARDMALSEVVERKKAETALKASYERHALLSRKAITAQEEERSRLSVELHDELGQILTAIRLEMGLVEKQLPKASDNKSYVLAGLIDLTEKATDELRGICKGLRPPLLDDLGLEPAAQLLVDEFIERAGINTEFDLPADGLEVEIPKEIALCTYRILQESLTNIRRHSKATNVNISLVYTSTGLELSVYDDGVGFDRAELGAMRGWGLEGMQERANLVNGTVNVRSVRKQGTSIVFQVPLDTPNETEAT
ncbi:MAG: sensor histidine kinase [Deltaproteobacteria bacterium]|nr:sensor histidine kinase [Deltaproteobacteria bacterium]